MPYLLPDSNVLRGRIVDPRTTGPWQTLLNESSRSGWTIVLSELVEWELAAILRRHLERQQSRARGATRALERFTNVPEIEIDVGATVAGEMARLRGDVLAAGGELGDVPDVSIAALALRAIDRRPPFDERGSGFRDAIIWETAIGLAAEGEAVLLISTDEAFAESDALHPQLAAEARSRCAAGGGIELAKTLHDALDGIKNPVPSRTVATPRYVEVADAMIEVCRQLDGYTLSPSDLARFGWPRGFDGVRISDAEWTTGPVWEVLREGADAVYRGVIGVRASIDARATAELLYDTEIGRLVQEGDLRDIGRGLLDDLDQFRVDRPLMVTFEMKLGPGPACRVLEIRLPEPTRRHQLRLDAA